MRKSPVIIAAGLLGLLVVLLVLFYLSPFSEIEPAMVCHGFEGLVDDPAHAGTIPVCGHPISGKDALYFPFKIKHSEAVEFCLNNTEKVEELCGVTIDQILFDDTAGFFDCTYITLDKESGRVQNFVGVIKTPKEYSETGVATVSGMSWKSKLTNFSFKQTCTEAALVGIGS
jgi:hypothetical protein